MRLDKYLSELNVGTRSQVKDYIKKGMISVNGVKALKADIKIDENKDVVTFQGKELNYQKFFYYMLHKPAGVVTATKDNKDRTVMDLMKGCEGKDLFPVGRLDKDTEGLLLITNDGDLSHNLLSPKKHVDKTYYVECDGSVTKEKLQALENGVDIHDKELTKPAKVKLISEDEDKYIIELKIIEGRFHQVKRMIQAIDGNVTYLKRLTMGSLILDESLDRGAYRQLTESEINSLKALS